MYVSCNLSIEKKEEDKAKELFVSTNISKFCELLAGSLNVFIKFISSYLAEKIVFDVLILKFFLQEK